jgi:hypothetical protein
MSKLFLIFFLSLLAAVPACLVYFGILMAIRPILAKLRHPGQADPQIPVTRGA